MSRRSVGLLVVAVVCWLVAVLDVLLMALLGLGGLLAVDPEDETPLSDFIVFGVIGLVLVAVGLAALIASLRVKPGGDAERDASLTRHR